MLFNFTDKNKKGYYVVLGIVLLIIVGFLFTGYESFNLASTSGGVAKVGNETISPREYQNVYNQRVQFFQQMMGGKNLTNKQIEQFGIKKLVMDSLINQKVLVNLAKNMGINPSNTQILKEIKSQEVFQTNKQFDAAKYKQLLAVNGLSPQGYEKNIKDGLATQKLNSLLSNYPASKKSTDELATYSSEGFSASVLEITHEQMKPFLNIPKEDLDNFLSNADNEQKLKDLYNRNISKYKTEEERKARHILISINDKVSEADALKKITDIKSRINKMNFSDLAKENTTDPSGKTSGGALGWFGRGKMVPPFEAKAFTMKKGEISDPVKTRFGYHLIILDDIKDAKVTELVEVKRELAKEYLQSNMNSEAKDLAAKVTGEIKAALEGSLSKAENIAKKYNLNFNKDQNINLISRKALNDTLSFDEFSTLTENSTYSFDKSAHSLIIKTGERTKSDASKNQASAPQFDYSTNFRNKLIEVMKEKLGVAVNNRAL